MKIIHSVQAPQPIGPYSQAVVHQGILYTSGQGPLDPQSGTIPEGIEAQTDLTCRNISSILSASNSNFSDVIKTTCFLNNMADFKNFNKIYSQYFISNPARSCVAVKELPSGFLCEIEVISISH
jgi:2-iminobutanoate/2-iminopropanoate deaminase